MTPIYQTREKENNVPLGSYQTREKENNVPLGFPDIPWKQIIGLRHRIVHDYFDVDREIVWEIIKKDLPKLKPKINKLKKHPALKEIDF